MREIVRSPTRGKSLRRSCTWKKLLFAIKCRQTLRIAAKSHEQQQTTPKSHIQQPVPPPMNSFSMGNSSRNGSLDLLIDAAAPAQNMVHPTWQFTNNPPLHQPGSSLIQPVFPASHLRPLTSALRAPLFRSPSPPPIPIMGSRSPPPTRLQSPPRSQSPPPTRSQSPPPARSPPPNTTTSSSSSLYKDRSHSPPPNTTHSPPPNTTHSSVRSPFDMDELPYRYGYPPSPPSNTTHSSYSYMRPPSPLSGRSGRDTNMFLCPMCNINIPQLRLHAHIPHCYITFCLSLHVCFLFW